jgi:hypothetical protein
VIARDALRPVTVITAAAILLHALAEPVAAQVWYGTSAPRRGSVEVGAGAAWTQGLDLGEQDATLTRNPGTGPDPFLLFGSSTELVPSAGARAHVGVYVSRSVSFEAGVDYSRPVLRTRLTDDAESAPAVTVSETLTRYVFEGSAVFHLNGLAFAGDRGVPFLIGGGGHVRELHQGNELVETGRQFHAGGGVKLWLGGGRRRRVGVRTQATLSVREGGFDFEEDRRVLPTLSASVIYLF